MADDFRYDVFLSYSSKDREVVRPIAERLRQDGLRVWFDEWELKPGDSIPAKIEDGLEHARVLVLCMSANAFGSDWAQLEAGTFRFRDPVNKERRFVPLRLDDAPIRGSLAQFLHIKWLPQNREQEYAKLLEACRLGRKASPVTATSDARPDLGPPAERSHGLRVRIVPTRNGSRQLAQIRLLNAGERPILIECWLVEWSDRTAVESGECERGNLPVRLQDHERADLLVGIDDHPVEELVSLGVVDAEQRRWRAAPKDIRRFIHVAKLHEPPKIGAQPDEPNGPSEVEISVSVSETDDDGPTRLEVSFKNLGPHDLQPHSARAEWEYDPSRQMPGEPGEPKIAETGGSVSLEYDKHGKTLKPNQGAVFYISIRNPLARTIVSVLADDVPNEKLRIVVSDSRWQWVAHSEEVPGAIREFARAVLRQMQ